MARALELARRGLGATRPNPAVGAVVVRDGEPVGEGHHPAAGQPHAEIFALEQAGERARGATLYVTLEPCHHHGRTPPCTERILQAGIRRVVAAMEDPDPRVRGAGIRFLRERGLEVTVGTLEEAARKLNAPYIKHRTTGRTYVTLKMAMSLDGKVATRRGESQWITGPTARKEGHRLRQEHDAILVGVGTVLADDPMLTVRHPELERPFHPLRVVLDTFARTPLSAQLVQTAREYPTLVVVGEGAPPERCAALEEAGVQVWRLPGESSRTTVAERVSVPALVQKLGEAGFLSLLVEGGPTVHWSFLQAGEVDRVTAFIAPMLLGGETRFSAVGGSGFSLDAAVRFVEWEVQTLDSGDLFVDAFVRTY
ncbi:MAG: riboflavin biosynthesis protein RibD [Candidatus Poribacteria bacterium]|nr:MAG: riboflavin biosynthesis protein RibD [Candidatus Poribacteria bacterium]